MNQPAQWFHRQLESSAEAFLWAFSLISPEYLYQEPRPGRWSAARILFHLARYEERIALPSMRQWLGGPRPLVRTPDEDALQEEIDWNAGERHPVQALIEEFKEVRAAQLVLLPRFPDHCWQEEREAIWKPVTLAWVLTKTYQHTLNIQFTSTPR